MKRQRIVALALALLLLMTSTACQSTTQEQQTEAEPRTSQIKSICELAVMECYYHNVAKFYEEDSSGVLLWKKDKHFWVEYSGVVNFGIDVSRVKMEVDGSKVTITLPEATVLDCRVDSSSLTEDSYIVAKDSADIEAADETKAFAAAQQQLKETASNDQALLNMAQTRAQKLLEDYVVNIGNATGKNYTIRWVYPDQDTTTTAASSSESTASSATS